MKFDLLSRNSIVILEELIADKELSKLIEYSNSKPLDGADIKNTGSLIMKRVFPTPYDDNVPEMQMTQLRMFFPDGQLQNKEVLHTQVVFQVLMHRDLWLIQVKDENGKYQKRIRPYDIMNRIVQIYEDKSIKTLGKIKFEGYTYNHIDKDYGLYSLVGSMMTL